MALPGSGETLTSFTKTTLHGQRSRLRAIANNAQSAVADALQRTSQDIIREMKTYPGETGGKYQRTYELQAHWKTIPTHGAADNHDGSMSVIIYNDVVDDYGRYYGIYVQGPWQTAGHAGTGWSKLEEVATRYGTAQGNRVRAAINRAGRG